MPECNKHAVNVSYLHGDNSRNGIVADCAFWGQTDWVHITASY